MGILQAAELFACLARHDVRYVLIGGLAAVLHGSPLPTLDADICPSADRSKEAANRPKDQRSLPVLRQLLEEIRRSKG